MGTIHRIRSQSRINVVVPIDEFNPVIVSVLRRCVGRRSEQLAASLINSALDPIMDANSRVGFSKSGS
jgi:hypothetical protein